MSLIFLTANQIIELHDEAIRAFGGDGGLLDPGKLESAAMAPIHYYFYGGADVAGVAAAYAYHVMQAHAFADGNKRVGHYSARTFVELNGCRLNASQQQLFDLYMSIASGLNSRDHVETQFRNWVTC